MYAPATAQSGIAYPANPSENMAAMNTRIEPTPANSDFNIFFLFLPLLSDRTAVTANPMINTNKMPFNANFERDTSGVINVSLVTVLNPSFSLNASAIGGLVV